MGVRGQYVLSLWNFGLCILHDDPLHPEPLPREDSLSVPDAVLLPGRVLEPELFQERYLHLWSY